MQTHSNGTVYLTEDELEWAEERGNAWRSQLSRHQMYARGLVDFCRQERINPAVAYRIIEAWQRLWRAGIQLAGCQAGDFMLTALGAYRSGRGHAQRDFVRWQVLLAQEIGLQLKLEDERAALQR